jgi:lysine 6-dehydrogenase
VEPVTFDGIGEVEAWHEGFMPWLLELPKLQQLKSGTQKTVRWPGYAAKVTVLKEMGMLSLDPIQVDGVTVKPKHVLDAVLYPHVKLEDQEHDITTFRVEAMGEKDGRRCHYKIDMVDYYDEATGMTSMARTTGYTGAIVARMIARGDLNHRGVWPPEQLVTGPLFDQLVAELGAVGIHFEMTKEQESALPAV